jgi:O-antigen ligase
VKAREDWKRTAVEIADWQQGAPLGLRARVAHDTARMAAARPWFGWGIGSFPVVFPVFQGDYLRDKTGRAEARFEFAHNDWLQLMAEAGLAGVLVVLVPVGAVASRTWREGRFPERWALGGCALVAAYAWIDFPFNNPAVCVLWVVMLLTASRGGRTKSPASSAPGS